MTLRTSLAALSVVVACATGLAAQTSQKPDPVEQHNSNAIWFVNWIGLSNATLKISAPNGKVTEVFAEQGTPVFQLTGRDAMDGVYRYSLKAATEETEEIVNQVDNGRGDAGSNTQRKPFNLSGNFVVSRGVIITPEAVSEDKE